MLKLSKNVPYVNTSLIKNNYEIAMLVQKFWPQTVGIWRSGEFCKGVELLKRGFVANRGTPCNFKRIEQ